MSFLSNLYKREQTYESHDDVRRYDIIKHLLHAHITFKKETSENIWRDIEIDYLHLAIMYVDLYLLLVKKPAPNDTSEAHNVVSHDSQITHNNYIIAAGCYLIAYKYECDRYECEFLEFLQQDLWHPWKDLKPILAFEWDLVKMLDWKINLVTPYTFICEYAKEIGIDPRNAGIISLKLLILEPCITPSKWGIVSLAIVDDATLKYFNVSKQDVKEINEVYQLLKDGWKQYKKDNPELRKVLSLSTT